MEPVGGVYISSYEGGKDQSRNWEPFKMFKLIKSGNCRMLIQRKKM